MTIIEKLIQRRNKLKKTDDQVLELSYEEYQDLMVFVSKNNHRPILSGDSGFDTKKGCYVLFGCDVVRKVNELAVLQYGAIG